MNHLTPLTPYCCKIPDNDGVELKTSYSWTEDA